MPQHSKDLGTGWGISKRQYLEKKILGTVLFLWGQVSFWGKGKNNLNHQK